MRSNWENLVAARLQSARLERSADPGSFRQSAMLMRQRGSCKQAMQKCWKLNLPVLWVG